MDGERLAGRGEQPAQRRLDGLERGGARGAGAAVVAGRGHVDVLGDRRQVAGAVRNVERLEGRHVVAGCRIDAETVSLGIDGPDRVGREQVGAGERPVVPKQVAVCGAPADHGVGTVAAVDINGASPRSLIAELGVADRLVAEEPIPGDRGMPSVDRDPRTPRVERGDAVPGDQV